MQKAWLVGGLSLVVLGCGDSAGTSTGAGGGTTSGTGGSTVAGTGGSTVAGTGGSTVAGTGGSTTSGGCPEGGAPQGMGGGVAACADIGASDCFSNYDCAATERCENVGTSDLPTACCVTGERGAGALGDGCVAENDCSSSLCIEGGTCGFTCSDKCTSDDDCPADLPSCIAIAFSGTSDKFCTP